MLTGVILAGGKNRRMGGQNKALLSFSNEKLIERQIRIMRQKCAEIIVVTNDPRSFLPILGNTVRIITDYIPGSGALSGMHAAFALAKCSDLWVVGCDMPFISTHAAELMLKRKQELQCQAVIPLIKGILHPLHGIYDSSCLQAITKLLENDQYRLSELFNVIHSEPVQVEFFNDQLPDLRFVFNLNTPEEYKKALQMDDIAIT